MNSVEMFWSSYEEENVNLEAIRKPNNLYLTKIPDVYALDLSHISKAVTAVPSLSLIPINLWESCYSVFRNHGINAQKFIDIIIEDPMFLSRPPNKLTKSFEIWRSCQFGEKNCLQLLIKYPHLLFISDEKEVITQVTYLRQYVKTTKNCYLLIKNSPNVITDNCEILDEKFRYLINIMRIDIPEIVKSQVFTKSLHHIEVRHKFLDRLGLFKVLSPKSDPNLPINNPRLYEIMDTDDETFAEIICNVTLTEYDTFKDLYIQEVNQKEELILENEVEK